MNEIMSAQVVPEVQEVGQIGYLTPPVQSVLSFGDYVVLPMARTLLRNGLPICIGARAFDLLVLLVVSRGEVVCKKAIMRHVWPSTTVDESNLRFQMAELRKVLGASRDLIKTIPGRGYLLAMDIETAVGVVSSRVPNIIVGLEISSGHRAVCDALRLFLNAVRRHPEGIASLTELIFEHTKNEARPINQPVEPRVWRQEGDRLASKEQIERNVA